MNSRSAHIGIEAFLVEGRSAQFSTAPIGWESPENYPVHIHEQQQHQFYQFKQAGMRKSRVGCRPDYVLRTPRTLLSWARGGMPCTSRLRPRPRSWYFGSARFVLSVAAIVQSGLHMTADAFAPPCPRCTRVESPAETHSSMHLPSGGAQLHFWSLPGTGFAADGRERWGGGGRRHRGGRSSSSAPLSSVGTANAALGAAVATGGAAVAVEERIGSQERSAISRGMNSVTTLTSIGARPVVESMTVAEEALLVEDVKALAAYLKMRSNLAIVLDREPSREEWAASVGISPEALAVQMKASQRAQERIVESNIGLIVLMARRHHPGALSHGTITNDVIQEGSLALLRAAETFDPGLGFRFSTYAGWWVRDRVQRCVVEQARLIRLPQHVHNFRRTLAKTKSVLLKELGRAPTYAEIAKRMEVDVARVIRYSNCPNTFSLDEAPSPSGGNAGGGGGGGGGGGIGARGKIAGAGYRHEKVACSMINPEQQAEAILFEGKLDKLMSVLSPDERLVVSLRYGLGGTAPTTLNEVAERAGSTRHRVRMMETRALNKLRRRPGRHRRGTARGAGGRGGRGGGRGAGGRGGRSGPITVEVA